ncbi:MAG: prephenate dehydrogenase [Demequinaceae bacterium]|nr:prephenate dehydrogenase [Demequinaceae bacterium]
MPHVHIVGAGLIGSSIGIGLSAEGWKVTIEDRNPKVERIARGIGAGHAPEAGLKPDLVIVAVPPSVAADEVVSALRKWPSAVVTDVASVKEPLAAAVEAVGLSDRYVGSHPMAGREVSGVESAQGDLFRARPWVVCANGAPAAAVDLVRGVAEALGADVVTTGAASHDAAVARTSHAPQVASSAVAASLAGLDPEDLALAGQGLRDVTRVAASDPGMWADIARLNGDHLRGALDRIVEDLTRVRDAGDIGEALAELVERGRGELARIPGKHGGRQRHWTEIVVIAPDKPGQLLRLLTDVAAVDVNIEDLTIEHSPRQRVGLVMLSIDPARAPELVAALNERGWEIAS